MKLSIIALALTSLASAAVHTVKVGNGGTTFSPNAITAAKGDTVTFEFDSAGHDVSQGDFGNACQPLAGSPFYSGTVSSGKTWTYTVKDTKPKAVYCAPHCTRGMVAVINGKGAKTYAKYSAAAKKASGSKAPSTVQGGTLS